MSLELECQRDGKIVRASKSHYNLPLLSLTIVAAEKLIQHLPCFKGTTLREMKDERMVFPVSRVCHNGSPHG